VYVGDVWLVLAIRRQDCYHHTDGTRKEEGVQVLCCNRRYAARSVDHPRLIVAYLLIDQTRTESFNRDTGSPSAYLLGTPTISCLLASGFPACGPL
jgi:hypothetical protein